jgi:hypothetical protein
MAYLLQKEVFSKDQTDNDYPPHFLTGKDSARTKSETASRSGQPERNIARRLTTYE